MLASLTSIIETTNGVMESGMITGGAVGGTHLSAAVDFYLFLLILGIAGIALGSWKYFTKKAYEPRRHKRVLGKGPFERLRDSIIGMF